MDTDHPYQPPASELDGAPAGLPGGEEDRITHGIVEPLMKTRPWVLFMGVMVLVGCGLMVLAGFAMVLFGAFMGEASEFGPLGGTLVGAFYFVLALVYLMPGVRLLQFAAAIKRIPDTPAVALEQAVRHQLSFWRFVGIVTIAIMAAYPVIIAVAVVFGVMSAK